VAVVGIDLGTTNTVVGVARDGHASAVRDSDGEYLIPSVVSFHPSGSILVGRPAKERRVVDAVSTIYSIKRLIGRSWNSEEVTHARARFPFEMREGPGQAALVVARGETFTLPEISAFVLRHAKSIAEKALGEPVDRAVITVPANFNDLQRAATKVAGRVAGLEVLRILNEPTAAALAYGYGKGKGERIAIYDFGGGTFDVTLLDLAGNVFEVLATAGNTFLGGDDIDLAIAERMAEACLTRFRVDARADAQVFERLRYYAEKIKVELSTAQEATIDVPDVGHGAGGKALRLTFTMTRAELETLASPIVQETFEVCSEALGIARLSPGNFDQVVLVGGSTRLPLVRARVAEYFARAPLDRINPDEVVAIGAGIQANALTGQERRRSLIPRPPIPAAREGSSAGRMRTEPGVAPPAPAVPGERKRVVTGLGLGPVSRTSRPPPLPQRRGVPAKKGGTLGGVGGPAPAVTKPIEPDTAPAPTQRTTERPPMEASRVPALDQPWGGEEVTNPDVAPFEPDTPLTPFSLEDEPTKVGAPAELIEAARAMATRGKTDPLLTLDEEDEITSANIRFAGMPLPSPSALPEPQPSERKLEKYAASAPSAPGPIAEPAPAMRASRPDTFKRTLLGGVTSRSVTPREQPAVRPSEPSDALAATFSSAPPEPHRLPQESVRPARPEPPLLVDVTPLSLCVETVSGYRDVIIERNTPVPCEQARGFVTARHGQTAVVVRVGQGESEQFANNTLLGEIELSGLRSAPRGEVQVVVTFTLDTDGMLEVRAADAQTGQASIARLRLVGLPDAAEVSRMAERHFERTQ
jgi:molecular chaperone DnaK